MIVEPFSHAWLCVIQRGGICVDLGLRGRTVLVTASSQGLGFACAEAFAREGARVVICARHLTALAAAAHALEEAGALEVLPVQADIDREGDRLALFDAIRARFGSLNAAVVNTGNPVGGWVDTVGENAWADAFGKWRAVVETDRLAADCMAGPGNGAIVNLLSRTAVQPDRSLALSSMIRAALANWTKMFADEMGPRGVRVLSVLPGLTRTAQIEQGLAVGQGASDEARGRDAGGEPGSPGERLEALAAARARREGVPLGRLGTPDSLGRFAVFLASPACDYVTGSLLRYDGGAIRVP